MYKVTQCEYWETVEESQCRNMELFAITGVWIYRRAQPRSIIRLWNDTERCEIRFYAVKNVCMPCFQIYWDTAEPCGHVVQYLQFGLDSSQGGALM